MNRDILWAPWRMAYITQKKRRGCIFCAAKKPTHPDYCFLKTRLSQAMLNIYPYNNGHVMVSPLRHVADLTNLTKAEMLDLFQLAARVEIMLAKLLSSDGFNIGINIGKSAGAGITGHMHVHIVPRWRGDNNFMPTLNNTKVLSQSLDELHKGLIHAAKVRD
ncbi:MAG: HIT domain-containing protein [Candidatus Omnitrophota bacterium]|nr:HIT domain-containing protein [Candidatus Omnitrophota bacterium]